MKLYDMGLLIFLVVIAGAAGAGMLIAKKNKPDSYAEELCEEVVEQAMKGATGIEVHVDFTPDSPEGPMSPSQAMRGPSGSGERLSPA